MSVVLCAGIDKALMDTRKMILEQAGHTVVLAMTIADIESACRENTFDVAVIGQLLIAPEKRRAFELVRADCPTARVLELCATGISPILSRADDWLEVPAANPGELEKRIAALVSAGRKAPPCKENPPKANGENVVTMHPRRESGRRMGLRRK